MRHSDQRRNRSGTLTRKVLVRVRAIVVAVVMSAVMFPGVAEALEWKYFHGRADEVSLDQARQDVERAPADLGSLYVLALVYFNAHRDREANAIFSRMLALKPGSVEAQWGQAEYRRRIYETAKAKIILENVIAVRPDFFPAYISLSHIKYFEKEFEEVVRLMLAVLKHDTTAVDITTLVRAHCIYAGAKGMIAYRGGPLSKVLNGTAIMNHLRIAARLRPDNVIVPYSFGCYYLLVPSQLGKNIDKAEAYFQKALALDPLVPDIYVRLAEVYALREEPEKAHDYLRQAVAIDPQCWLVKDIESNEFAFVTGWSNK